MSNKNFDYIMFDAGGTLLGINADSENWYEKIFVDACAEQGCVISIAEVHDVLRRALKARHFDKRSCKDISVREFWLDIYTTIFTDLLGAKGQALKPSLVTHLAADYIDRFEDGEFIKLYSDVLPCLENLRDEGYPMAVVSHFGAYLPTFLEKLNVSGFFEFATVSCKQNEEVSASEMFDRAIKEAGVTDSSRILFVGDNYEEDVIPALDKGFTALLLDRHNKYDHLTDIAKVKNLCELKDYL